MSEEKGRSVTENTLLNITAEDEVYRSRVQWARRILRSLRKREDIFTLVATTDMFYAHYSLNPIVKHEVKDNRLENLRSFLFSYLMRPDVEAIRKVTVLNEKLSQLFALAFVKELDSNNPQTIGKAANKALEIGKTGYKLQDIAGKGLFESRELLDLTERVISLNRYEIVDLAHLILRNVGYTGKKSGYISGKEVFGIRRTGNLLHARPQEVALGNLALMKLASDGLTAWEKRIEYDDRVLILLDKSGSMSGTKETLSKATTLAIIRQASKSGNKVSLRLFDARVHEEHSDMKQVIREILTIENRGGTNLAEALRVASESSKKFHSLTAIIITDGRGEVPTDFKRSNKFRLISSVLGERNERLQVISDLYLEIREYGDTLRLVKSVSKLL